MLVVILGAGASYDSSPFLVPSSEGRDLRAHHPESARPPLTLELFNRERPQFAFLARYPAAGAVIRHIQRELAAGARNIEQILGDLQVEEATHPQRKRHLMALRFYLRDYLTDCSQRWWDFHSGVLTYAEFTDTLHRFSVSTGERVCYVSFNYDTLLDRTLEAQHLRGLRHIDGYVAPDGPLYIKVHGSENWRRVTSKEFQTDGPKRPDDVIGSPPEPTDLDATDEYVVEGRPDEVWGRSGPSLPLRVVVPALAVPVERKTERNFEMPQSHRLILEEAIGEASRVLIVGWRGSEEHFNELLRSNAPGLALPVTTVCGAGGGSETAANLGALGFCDFMDAAVGFNDYVESGGLRSFLGL